MGLTRGNNLFHSFTQFDLAAGHQLPGSLQVPLASFPEGDYHFEIKVADKVSGKSITRDVTFTIAPPVQ